MSKKWKTGIKVFALLIPFLVIAASMMSLYKKVQQTLHENSCQPNLKQLGLAVNQYTQDNDGMGPNISDKRGYNTWRQAIYPYVHAHEVYHCAVREEQIGRDGFSQNYAANYTGNYGKTQADKGEGAFAGPGSYPLTYDGFKTPAQLIMLTEAENNNRPEFNIDNASAFGPGQNKLWEGHRGACNYLFVDGHVKWQHPLDTYQTDSTGKVILNEWYRNGKKPLSSNGIAVLKDVQQRFQGQ